MSTNSIFVPYTGLRSTANAVGAYVKDWKSVAQFSFAPEDLIKPGFIGSAVAVYKMKAGKAHGFNRGMKGR